MLIFYLRHHRNPRDVWPGDFYDLIGWLVTGCVDLTVMMCRCISPLYIARMEKHCLILQSVFLSTGASQPHSLVVG